MLQGVCCWSGLRLIEGLQAGGGRCPPACLPACLDVKPRFMGHYKKTVKKFIKDGIDSGKYNKINN